MRFEQITEGDPHQRVSVGEKCHIEPSFKISSSYFYTYVRKI